jgi:hypothetical protein
VKHTELTALQSGHHGTHTLTETCSLKRQLQTQNYTTRKISAQQAA